MVTATTRKPCGQWLAQRSGFSCRQCVRENRAARICRRLRHSCSPISSRSASVFPDRGQMSSFSERLTVSRIRRERFIAQWRAKARKLTLYDYWSIPDGRVTSPVSTSVRSPKSFATGATTTSKVFRPKRHMGSARWARPLRRFAFCGAEKTDETALIGRMVRSIIRPRQTADAAHDGALGEVFQTEGGNSARLPRISRSHAVAQGDAAIAARCGRFRTLSALSALRHETDQRYATVRSPTSAQFNRSNTSWA